MASPNTNATAIAVTTPVTGGIFRVKNAGKFFAAPDAASEPETTRGKTASATENANTPERIVEA